jgi:anti-sigma B factor antagonist
MSPGWASTSDQDGVRTIRFGGEIDVASSRALRGQALDAAANASGPVAIDLCDVTFLDSTGLGLLIDIRMAVRGELATVSNSRAVRNVITLTGLQGVLGLRDGFEQAA